MPMMPMPMPLPNLEWPARKFPHCHRQIRICAELGGDKRLFLDRSSPYFGTLYQLLDQISPFAV